MARKVVGSIVLDPQSSAPTSPSEGQMYYDSTEQKVRVRNSSDWADTGGVDISTHFDADIMNTPTTSGSPTWTRTASAGNATIDGFYAEYVSGESTAKLYVPNAWEAVFSAGSNWTSNGAMNAFIRLDQATASQKVFFEGDVGSGGNGNYAISLKVTLLDASNNAIGSELSLFSCAGNVGYAGGYFHGLVTAWNSGGSWYIQYAGYCYYWNGESAFLKGRTITVNAATTCKLQFRWLKTSGNINANYGTLRLRAKPVIENITS